jgi:hypothetical protein
MLESLSTFCDGKRMLSAAFAVLLMLLDTSELPYACGRPLDACDITGLEVGAEYLERTAVAAKEVGRFVGMATITRGAVEAGAPAAGALFPSSDEASGETVAKIEIVDPSTR